MPHIDPATRKYQRFSPAIPPRHINAVGARLQHQSRSQITVIVEIHSNLEKRAEISAIEPNETNTSTTNHMDKCD
jgi:hypothetical protein